MEIKQMTKTTSFGFMLQIVVNVIGIVCGKKNYYLEAHHFQPLNTVLQLFVPFNKILFTVGAVQTCCY